MTFENASAMALLIHRGFALFSFLEVSQAFWGTVILRIS